MNSELQKKWFVYLSDHHEGPFTPSELSQKQQTGQVTAQSYVWAEGMADWKPLSEVNELTHELKKIESRSSGETSEKSEISRTPLKSIRKQPMAIKVILASLLLMILVMGALSLLSRTSNEELHASLRPTLNKLVDRVPMMGGLFHLVPGTGDLKPEIRKELEQAQLGSPENTVKISFALSQTDPNRPSFYIASNLPDRTKFDLYVIGNGDTLLNRLQFRTQTVVTLARGLGKSEVLLVDNGQPLAKGEYQIWVTEAAEQDEAIKEKLSKYPANRPGGVLPEPLPNSAKFVAGQTVFIGGARDEVYLTRLKAFHEKIKQSSEKELVELRQYTDTLILQYQTLTSEFDRILKAKKITDAHRSNWKKSSEKWAEINNQLEQTIQTWSKETLQNEFFYGAAFDLVKSAYESIKELYKVEDSFVDKPTERNAFAIQHGKALSETRQTLDQLKAKIEFILKAPKSPNGLPKREGL